MVELTAGHENETQKPLKPMEEVNLALKECGFGRFHIRLLFTSFLGHTAGVIASATTPYLLPLAECDLDMDLLEKGVLNGMPYVGMMVSCVGAGFLTDTFGRKKFLLLGLGGLFFFSVTSGLSQSYEILIASKFFEGFLFAISFSPLLALTSEFCHPGIRDRVMLVQSSFIAVAQVVVALKSWGILTFDWNVSFFDGSFVLHTWNFYLLIFSSWAFLATVFYAFLPESPKYFVTQHKYDEARAILVQVYEENTRKPADTFKYIDLWKNKSECIPEANNEDMKSKLCTGFENIKPMFRKPLLFYLIFFCSINFFTMQQYNVLRLWFPQLSTIVEHYRDDGNKDLCAMLDTYTADLRDRTTNATINVDCIPVRSGTETYVNAIIIGLVCFLPNVLTSLLVKKVGKKNLLLVCGLISVGCTIGLRWAITKTDLVSLYSTVVATARAMISLTQAMVLEYFPTSGRSLAIGFIMMSGRTGTLVGNVMFPILLNMGCVVPFFTLAALLLGITSLALFLPAKEK
ncbi:unnamed protein product [Leptosia nina]|uniref:Major facilitator superfamily (MFS) profile domain-containing protein n=1 Tax=Leptosia nina TaxID=320188 RepID=A0AAV1JU84_9NEOP